MHEDIAEFLDTIQKHFRMIEADIVKTKCLLICAVAVVLLELIAALPSDIHRENWFVCFFGILSVFLFVCIIIPTNLKLLRKLREHRMAVMGSWIKASAICAVIDLMVKEE